MNGLSVMQLGEFSFGMPHRITARVRLGAGKVVDIEREAELGGRLHSKGVLILSGFLAGRYAANKPLSMAAIARRWLRSAKASCSSREMPDSRAWFSATSPVER